MICTSRSQDESSCWQPWVQDGDDQAVSNALICLLKSRPSLSPETTFRSGYSIHSLGHLPLSTTDTTGLRGRGGSEQEAPRNHGVPGVGAPWKLPASIRNSKTRGATIQCASSGQFTRAPTAKSCTETHLTRGRDEDCPFSSNEAECWRTSKFILADDAERIGRLKQR